MNPLEGSDDPFDDPLRSISAASTSSRPIPLATASAGHWQDSGLSLTPTAAWPSPKPSRDASQNRAPSLTKGTIEEVCEACSQGDLLLLEDLLNANEPNTFTLVNSTGKTGLTPLHKAAARGRTDIIALLLDKGAMILDSSGETPVHLAALRGHLRALQALIDFGGRDAAEAQDSDGWTPLHNACSQGFLDCVRYLVEDVGVHVDALSKAHYTPLMNAAGKGHLPVVNYLLSKRLANPMLRSLYGETAYDIAAVSEVYICEILAQHEAALWSEKQASQPTDERMPYNPLALHVSCHVMLHENQRLDLRLTSLGHRASFTSSAISKNDHRSPFTLPPSCDGLNPTDFHLPVYRPDLGLPTSSNPFQVVLPPIALSFAAQLQKKRPDHGRARPSNSHRAASRSVSGMSALSEGTSAVSDSSYFAANAALPVTASTERAWFWMTDWFIDYSSPRVDPEHGWEYARSFDDPPDAWTPEPPLDLQRLMEQSTAPLSSSSTNRWVRRRRWIRVMRRRLDRPGLPFADLDDPETVLSPNTSDGRSEQELSDLNAPDEADYVARARFKAGVHHRLASRDLDGSSVRSGKARQEAGKAEARKLVLRLESAISELRIGLLADEDVERVQQASALLETYAARLEEVKAQTPLDDAVEDAEDQPFVYSAQPTADASTPTTDYFTHPGASTSQRPPDLTPDLRLASDFRVPTQDSPIVRVTNSMPTAISALPRWEPDASVDQCRRCSMPFSFLRRRHHCRKCGRVVCNACSSTHDQLDPAEVVLDPSADLLTRLSVASLKTHRTCMPCHEEVIARSNRPIGSPSGIPVDSDLLTAVFDPASQAPDSPLASSVASEQSVLTECPVCGFKLSSLVNQLDQEAHVRNCLNSGRSSAIQSHRYLVFKLGESPLVGQECIICFEEFVIGANVARLMCLCYFHAECIKSWLKRSHGCPLHQRE